MFVNKRYRNKQNVDKLRFLVFFTLFLQRKYTITLFMKKLCFVALLLSLSFQSPAQNVCEPPIYNFNNKSNVSGTVGVGTEFTFTNVLTNVNAIVKITKLQNASINNANMDNSAPYAQAWQPFITFPSSRNGSADSSYIEFHVRFVANSQNSPVSTQGCMAMTIVDCDGNGSGNTYREMVKVSLPGTPMGIANSTIIGFEDSRWMLFKSGPSTFNNIDTVNKAAMGQVNFPSGTSNFYMRVGVVGPISANTQRQFSFYFRSFTGLLVPLPVKLVSFTSTIKTNQIQLNWISAEEHQFSHYEVYQSVNGKDYQYKATVNAKGGSNALNYYSFTDARLPGDPDQIFYKLKLVDLNGKFEWSSVRSVEFNQTQAAAGNIFPNPAVSDFSIVSAYEGSIVNICIKDASGMELSSYAIHHESSALIDISNLSPGFYNVLVQHEDGSSAVYKLIKQ